MHEVESVEWDQMRVMFRKQMPGEAGIGRAVGRDRCLACLVRNFDL